MNISKCKVIIVLAISLGISGCGSGPVEEKIKVQSSAIVESAKKTLEGMEKSGTLGSGITGLESDINGIKSSDPGKGEALTKLYRELQGATTPETVKAKAKEMLGKL